MTSGTANTPTIWTCEAAPFCQELAAAAAERGEMRGRMCADRQVTSEINDAARALSEDEFRHDGTSAGWKNEELKPRLGSPWDHRPTHENRRAHGSASVRQRAAVSNPFRCPI
ncbi:hypothetical protein LBMAG56_49170 [Verrucomicrobiota bacterium]|nr:hypothetical protein LBMAG56_49170 [Verrucomicrobiota bacterium]